MSSRPEALDRAFWDDQFQENPALVMIRNPFLSQAISSLVPGRALDLGCGTGANSLMLNERGWQVTGVDWSSHAIELARQGAAGATFICADIRTWQSAQQFDLIVLSFAIPEGRHDAIKVVERAKGMLKAGGRLLIFEWDKSMEAIWNQGVSKKYQINNMLLSAEEIKELIDGLVVEEERVEPILSRDLFSSSDDPRRQYQSHMNTIFIQARKPVIDR